MTRLIALKPRPAVCECKLQRTAYSRRKIDLCEIAGWKLDPRPYSDIPEQQHRRVAGRLQNATYNTPVEKMANLC